jgi:hypothetical protein
MIGHSLEESFEGMTGKFAEAIRRMVDERIDAP